jgi:hypothetical protein
LIETANRAATANLSLQFIVGDIGDFTLDKEFGFAMLPDRSFPVLLTQDDQISFLRSVHRHLSPGGAFAFNMFQTFWHLLKARHHDKHLNLMHVGTEPPYKTFDSVTQLSNDAENTKYPRPVRHSTLSELNLLLRLTVFKIVELFGDIDKRPFKGLGVNAKESDEYTIVAEKTKAAQ